MSILPEGTLDAVAQATAGRSDGVSGGLPSSGRSAVVALAEGKSVVGTLHINDGVAVVGSPADEADVRLVFTAAVVDAWLGGGDDLAVAYMRGDLKPEGSTGALLVAFDVLDDTAVKAAIASAR